MLARLVVLACLSLPVAHAHAQITVTDPWVRGTVAAQKTTGAFMTLTSVADARLVEVKSPVAAIVEVHEMAMTNNTMTMRAIPALALPAKQPVALKPGGYHIMLMALKQPLKAGDTVQLTLTFESKDGKRNNVDVNAPVRPLGAPTPTPAPAGRPLTTP